jgi:hypothetical protein
MVELEVAAGSVATAHRQESVDETNHDPEPKTGPNLSTNPTGAPEHPLTTLELAWRPVGAGLFALGGPPCSRTPQSPAKGFSAQLREELHSCRLAGGCSLHCAGGSAHSIFEAPERAADISKLCGSS